MEALQRIQTACCHDNEAGIPLPGTMTVDLVEIVPRFRVHTGTKLHRSLENHDTDVEGRPAKDASPVKWRCACIWLRYTKSQV